MEALQTRWTLSCPHSPEHTSWTRGSKEEKKKDGRKAQKSAHCYSPHQESVAVLIGGVRARATLLSSNSRQTTTSISGM
ncbi:hypothetical protein TYRP_002712 [Tyrophagus putrescentiae]|nr:hypothetical protein TYRP_002712 [Tyrophagus putrescentiae]